MVSRRGVVAVGATDWAPVNVGRVGRFVPPISRIGG